MTWTERADAWLCPPYQIHRGVMGMNVWLYAPDRSACLAQQIPSLEHAKSICADHKAKQSKAIKGDSI